MTTPRDARHEKTLVNPQTNQPESPAERDEREAREQEMANKAQDDQTRNR